MSEINFSSGNKIAEAIDKRIIAIAKQVANKSTVNRTVFCRVTAKNNGLFSLRINNTVYTNVIALKNSNYINVGDKVVCLVPNNQFNDLLILGVADGSLLTAGEYTLNQASATELGGIKANNRTVENQEVRIDPNTGFLYYSQGKSIESIEKTSTSGLIDTYTITYTDGSYTTFTVTNADQIDIQYMDGQLQWKYATETTWTTLFSIDNTLSNTSTNPIQNQAVSNAITEIRNNMNNSVVKNISTTISGDNFSLIQTLINLNTQATTQQSINIPLANATTAGLMSSSDFSSLQDLKELSTTEPVVLYDMDSDDPNINLSNQQADFVNGMQGGYTVQLDTSEFRCLRVFASLNGFEAQTYVDIKNAKKLEFFLKATHTGILQFYFMRFALTTNHNIFASGQYCIYTFNASDGTFARTIGARNADFYIYRIEGIK